VLAAPRGFLPPAIFPAAHELSRYLVTLTPGRV
jgi:hypothetical protein